MYDLYNHEYISLSKNPRASEPVAGSSASRRRGRRCSGGRSAVPLTDGGRRAGSGTDPSRDVTGS